MLTEILQPDILLLRSFDAHECSGERKPSPIFFGEKKGAERKSGGLL